MLMFVDLITRLSQANVIIGIILCVIRQNINPSKNDTDSIIILDVLLYVVYNFFKFS